MALILCDSDFLIKATNDPLPSLALFLSECGYELATIERIKDELEGLSRSENRPTARRAKNALRSIYNGRVKLESNEKRTSSKTDADSLLIKFALENKEPVAIATMDHVLLSILERRKLSYLTLRNNRPFFRTE